MPDAEPETTTSTVHFPVPDLRQIVSNVRIGTPASIDKEAGKVRARGPKRDFVAVWDTGASHTCAVPRVIEAAQLSQRGFITNSGIDGVRTRRPVFPASIVMATRDGVTLQFTEIVRLEQDDQLGGVDILIGMDIISRGMVLLAQKPGGGLTFTFVVEEEQWTRE